MKLNIGIAGTRGVPNQYGGFEQFASFLAEALLKRGHEVTVYNTHRHAYQESEWRGVKIVHCYDPERMGTAGQFVYDLNCIRDARTRKFDILLMLGYTSSSVWGRLFPRKCIVVTNMDGMEWKRSKYSRLVRSFLAYAERLAVQFSDHCVADSVAIKDYLEKKYDQPVDYISYGAEIPQHIDAGLLNRYNLLPQEYHLLVARMEPENNIEMILQGLEKRRDGKKIVVVSNVSNAFGKSMIRKFANVPQFVCTGAIFDRSVLDALRRHCCLYFHGHSVGGTNPSLLEAMAAGALICAHNNVFNRAVLGEYAHWFSDADDIAELKINELKRAEFVRHNLETIRNHHTWDGIVDAYESLFLRLYKSRV